MYKFVQTTPVTGQCLVVQIKVSHLPNFRSSISFVNREPRIVKLLASHGPLIAAVDASTWQHYLGGIIQYHCFNDLNHAVQITGYDLSGSDTPKIRIACIYIIVPWRA